MEQINSEILRQVETKDLFINEGVAVVARLVESASRPLSNDELHPVKAVKIRDQSQLSFPGIGTSVINAIKNLMGFIMKNGRFNRSVVIKFVVARTEIY